MKDLFRILQWAVGLRSPRENPLFGEIDPTILLEIRYKMMAEKNKIPSGTPLLKARFTVFDLETTGLYPFGGDEITSVSAVIVENGQIQKDRYFDSLVNPGRPVPKIATEITGITDETVRDAPSVLWVLNQFLDFSRNSILVAHCADFDLNFINLKLKQNCHTRISHPIVDTYLMASAFLTGKNCTSLDCLIKLFGLTVDGRHTSLGDAMVTAELLVKFLYLMEERGIKTLEDLNHYLQARSFQ